MIRILLVDDNLTFLAAVRKFLAVLPGAQVIAEAHDGRQALVQAAQWRPDLVLLDIVMPELNGLKVAQHLQAWPQPPHIIFLSMHDSTAYRAAARELGVLAFVGKADFVADLPPVLAALTATGGARPAGDSA